MSIGDFRPRNGYFQADERSSYVGNMLERIVSS
jgi:hypothetical protein